MCRKRTGLILILVEENMKKKKVKGKEKKGKEKDVARERDGSSLPFT